MVQVVPIDTGAARQAIQRVGAELAELITVIPDPNAPTRKLKWTLGETAAHVVQTVRLHNECIRGEVSAREFDVTTFGRFLKDQNDERIRAEPEREPKRLADALRAVLEDFETEAADRSGSDRIEYPGGYSLEFALTCATLLAELLIHGHDVARSIGRSWSIKRGDALLAIYTIPAMLPLAVDPEGIQRVLGKAHVRIRGGECFSIEVQEGSAHGGRCDDGADVTISGAPVPYLLVSYGRVSPVRAALTGQIISWGRKPFFPLKLQRGFRNP